MTERREFDEMDRNTKRAWRECGNEGKFDFEHGDTVRFSDGIVYIDVSAGTTVSVTLVQCMFKGSGHQQSGRILKLLL